MTRVCTKCQAEIQAGFPFEAIPLCQICGIEKLAIKLRDMQFATDGELEELSRGLDRLHRLVIEEQGTRTHTGWNGSEFRRVS